MNPNSNIYTPIVFIVDDDESVQKSLRRLLTVEGFRVEAFSSADEFLIQPREPVVSCLVLDLSMPKMDGLTLQKELYSRDDQIPIIFVTGQGDIPSSVRAMKLGAIDFLPKPFSNDQLLAAIQTAHDASRKMIRKSTEEAVYRAHLGRLTPREREVMECVIAGLLNKQIASELDAAEKTIKIHRGRMMKKMEFKSVAELVRVCEKLGIQPRG